MKLRRLGLCVATLVVLCSLPLLFLGCWPFDDDDDEGQGKTSKYVMVANTNADSISVFKIASDGVLTSVDNVDLAEGSAPTHISLTPNEKFLYIVNSTAKNDSWDDNASIGAYTYNNSTGAVTEIAGSPFSVPPDEYGDTGTFIHQVITPDGKFLYVTDQSRFLVHGFRIQDNGALTYMASVDAYDAHGIAMDPKGKFLFVGSENDYIFSFAIADNGALTQVEDPVDVYGAYVELAVTPNGKYLYGAGNNYVGVLSIADNGALTVLYNEAIEADSIKTLAITPNGQYLYTGNWDSGTVYGGKILSDGDVEDVSLDPYDAGSKPKSVAVTRDSRYLYVANYGSGDITGFDILSDGTLEFCDTYPLPEGAGPKFIVALP